MNIFNAVGNKGVIVRFPCSFCDNARVVSEEVEAIPDHKAGESSNIYKQNFNSVICDRCNHEYQIEVHVGTANGSVLVTGVKNENIKLEEIPDPIEEEYYLQQYSVTTRKEEFYENYHSIMLNLKKLNELDPGEPELHSILKAQIHVGAVTNMETFLSDTFINLSLENDAYIRNFVKSFPEFKKQKFELNEIYDQIDNIKDTAKKAMYDIIYHNLPKVQKMYESTFGIQFPDYKEILQAIIIRHDLVHRNGKTKTGDAVALNRRYVEITISTIDDFVIKIAEALDIKPRKQKSLDDLADDLPF